jgi:hypothetical protein
MPRQDKNWGGLHLKKGSYQIQNKGEEKEFFSIYAWDASDNKYCPDCEIYMSCPYADGRNHTLAKRGEESKPKCYFEVEYLSKVIRAAYKCAGGKVTEDQILRIGLEMVPLYAQLFKFKLYEYYMKMYYNEGLIVVSEKGMKKVHPIYKEIRETVKTISLLWKDITGGQSAKKLPTEGDRDFAEQLTAINAETANGSKFGRADKRLKEMQDEGRVGEDSKKEKKKGNETKKKRRRRT